VGAARPARHTFLAQALASLLAIAVVLPLIVFPLLNIQQGGRQEILGPLFQQTARYIVEHPDEVTDEEKEAMSESQIEEWETKIKDSIIMSNTIIGENCEVYKAVLDGDIRVWDNAVIGGQEGKITVLGSGTVVGKGATIEEGAMIAPDQKID